MNQVSITVESKVAFAYLNAGTPLRKEAEKLVNRCLKDLLLNNKEAAKKELFKTMDRISNIARANGLTPKILEDILNEKK